MPVAKKKPSKKTPVTKAARNGEAAEARYIQQPPSATLPIPGEPPPLISNYEGKQELLRELPGYSVDLDAAAFMWLWRIVEAKALHHHQSATMRTMSPEQVAVALRAAAAFREATGTTNRRLNDLSKGRKRVLKRV